MADYRETLDDLEFARETAKMSPEALLRFTAQQAFKANRRISIVADIADCNRRRIDKIVKNQNRVLGIFAGIGLVIGAATAAIVNWLLNR